MTSLTKTYTLYNNSWIHKYAPKKISDITCNTKAIKTICDWLDIYNTNKVNELKKMADNNQKKEAGIAKRKKL